MLQLNTALFEVKSQVGTSRMRLVSVSYLTAVLLEYTMLVSSCFVMETHEFLEQLDRKMSKLMTKPIEEKGGRLLKDLHLYQLMMHSVAEKLHNRSPGKIDCPKAMYISGKPSFLRTSFNGTHLFNTFKWIKSDLKRFNFLVEENQKEWMNMKLAYILHRKGDDLGYDDSGSYY